MTLSRKCIVTNKIKPRNELIRIAKTKDNKIIVDSNKGGRGAYISKNISVLKDLKNKKILNRVFKMNVPITIYQQIEDILSKQT